MFRNILGRNGDLILVIGMMGILLVLFAPVPPVLLDLLLITNFAFALSILLLTFYVDKPVAFSTFPSLLLVATLFRLSLNVAATRLILTRGEAGDVIGSIGAFGVQGSFVVGLVVFFILVVVQYVVVTSGAQRVSEVAARFVLDSMPGQQMSIDADLNMGMIDQNEAKRRRKDLEREASFYGAMDGASKFVKGDAVAGIIILLINIFAGWIIGMVQMEMDWMTALQTFTLLTIGDGIVTQIPALVISTATGVIVTRSSADQKLSQEIFRQMTSAPSIMLIVVGALLLLLMLPGMPKWPALILAAGAGVAWFLTRRRGREADLVGSVMEQSESTDAKGQTARPNAPIEVIIGGALSQHWQSQRPVLSERIVSLRGQQERATGFAFPAVVFQDGDHLDPNGYEIALFGVRHAHSKLYPDMTLAIGTSTPKGLGGIEARDPAFGLPGMWVSDDQRDKAQEAGYTLVDPITVLITHLGEVLRTEAPNLLSRAEVVAMLEGVRSRQPGLVEELIPALLTVSDVQRILQNLLAEDVPIRNIDAIAEALVDVARQTKDPAELTELVRQKLAHTICQSLRGTRDELSVLSLNPRVEAQLAESLRRSDGRNALVIDPRLAEQLIHNLLPLTEAMMRQSLAPVLLCGPEIRRHLKTFTRRSIPRLAVLSVSEIPHTIDLTSFGVVNVEAAQPA